MKQILKKILPEIIDIRHKIHANPELANEEIKTAALVAETLKKYGYEVIENIATTGVLAVLDSGKPGKTVALRADMDALPIQEQTNLPYQSKTAGKMHACGHDGHTATLLAVAIILAECRDRFTGKIKFIFQMAEETGTGAVAMIEAGVLENPHVDAIFGYHNTPRSKAGVLKTKVGCIHAGQEVFTIKIKGRGGHAAHPQMSIDPIYIGSLLVQAIQAIVSRFILPTDPVVISVTQFHGGNTHNIIPDEVMLNGTIRTVNSTTQKTVRQQLIDIVNGIVTTYRATATISFSNFFLPVNNHMSETELVIQSAKKVIGEENVEILLEPSMGSEDFSYYLENVHGCFFWIGTGLEQLRIHTSQYEFNDDILPVAAEIMATVAIDYLRQ